MTGVASAGSRKSERTFANVRERIAWSYAVLACAHAAKKAERTKYTRLDYMIRAKLFAGLRDQRMAMSSLFDDEKLKLRTEPCCAFCGIVGGTLTIDHLIPRKRGGSDDGSNLVRACSPCNSSKRDRDFLVWTASRGETPSLMLLRRYLKLVARWVDDAELMEAKLDHPRLASLPLVLDALPTSLPPLQMLKLA